MSGDPPDWRSAPVGLSVSGLMCSLFLRRRATAAMRQRIGRLAWPLQLVPFTGMTLMIVALVYGGARFSSKKRGSIVRIVLAVVVILLIIFGSQIGFPGVN